MVKKSRVGTSGGMDLKNQRMQQRIKNSDIYTVPGKLPKLMTLNSAAQLPTLNKNIQSVRNQSSSLINKSHNNHQMSVGSQHSSKVLQGLRSPTQVSNSHSRSLKKLSLNSPSQHETGSHASQPNKRLRQIQQVEQLHNKPER